MLNIANALLLEFANPKYCMKTDLEILIRGTSQLYLQLGKRHQYIAIGEKDGYQLKRNGNLRQMWKDQAGHIGISPME